MDRGPGRSSNLGGYCATALPMRWLHWLVAHDCQEDEPFPDGQIELPLSPSEAELDFIEREVREAQQQEAARERGVQARLIGLLGLSSLVTTVLSGAAGLASSVGIQWSDLVLIIVLFPFAYVSLQALAAMYYTVKGLMPRSHLKMVPWQKSDHASTWNRRDRLARHARTIRTSDWASNRRLEDMSCALGSLKRLAWGSAVLMVSLLIAVLDQRIEFVPDVLEELRKLSENRP